MDRDRDEEQEEILRDMIGGGDDITSHFLNDSGEGVEDLDRRDGSGEEMEDLDRRDGSGEGTLTTKSGEVY